MKIQFFGSAREVGRSCIVVDDKYLLDCGIKISEDGQEYPLEFDPKKIAAVFLSHAHLDHCGALPYFNAKGLECPVYCTKMTKQISKILLKDSIHVEMLSSRDPEYSSDNIRNVLSNMVNVNYNRREQHGSFAVTYLDAGHIPGSASVLLETNKKKILYTGDINCIDTNLIHGLTYSPEEVDVMICETTYGNREHTPRDQTEKKFLDTIGQVLKRKGVVLVPTFSVGRAQELILMLQKRNFNVPIYMDGMAKKVTNLLKTTSTIKNSGKFNQVLSKVEYVKSPKRREEIIKKPCIIVTTSGMMVGGPILNYLKHLYHDQNSAVLMTGYQAEGCNGRMLLETGKVMIDGIMLNVKCHYEKFDFSAHAGRKELVELINRIKPKHLILNHGDPEAMQSLEAEFKDTYQTHVPNLGETILIT